MQIKYYQPPLVLQHVVCLGYITKSWGTDKKWLSSLSWESNHSERWKLRCVCISTFFLHIPACIVNTSLFFIFLHYRWPHQWCTSGRASVAKTLWLAGWLAGWLANGLNSAATISDLDNSLMFIEDRLTILEGTMQAIFKDTQENIIFNWNNSGKSSQAEDCGTEDRGSTPAWGNRNSVRISFLAPCAWGTSIPLQLSYKRGGSLCG